MKAWGKKSLVPMIKQYNNGNIYIPADYLHPKSVSYASKYLVLSHIFIADLSMTGHLNAKLIISSLEMEQHAFCAPQFIYIFGYIHVDK